MFKEEKVILCCTHWNLNLKVITTFRSKGFHLIFKAVMNPQQQLQISTESMQKMFHLWYRNITDLKTLSHKYRPALIDQVNFSMLIGQITAYAINQINFKWVIALQNRQKPHKINFCCCMNAVQYALLCHHNFYEAVIEHFPIPLSIINPHWWLDRPRAAPSNWAPQYHYVTIDQDSIAQPTSLDTDTTQSWYLAAEALLDQHYRNLSCHETDELSKAFIQCVHQWGHTKLWATTGSTYWVSATFTITKRV